MMISGLILTLVIVGAIAYALGWRPSFIQSGPPKTSETPLDVLKARYARGEISREEYEQMRRDLEG